MVPDTMQSVMVKRDTEIWYMFDESTMTIAYKSRGVCRIVIRYVDLSWMLYFALPVHNRVSHWLREVLPVSTLLVIANHMRVLKNDIVHG